MFFCKNHQVCRHRGKTVGSIGRGHWDRSRKGTNYNNMGTAFLGRPERATFRQPIPVGILSNPIDDGLLLLRGDALVGMAYTLEDVVDVLGDSEDSRSRFGNCCQG